MYRNNQANYFNKSLNVGRNVMFGLINRFFAMLMPFIVRTVLIYRFGVFYLGLNSLCTSIFQMLNLAELGFGTAVVYCLYRPVAENDKDKICAYLGTLRKIYRIIGLIILAIGFILMPFYPYLLKGNMVPNDVNLFIWYAIFLADTAVSYLLFGYKTVIPTVLQRIDLVIKIDTVVLTGKSLLQIFFLLNSDNIYYYLLSSLFFTVVRNLLVSSMVDRYYPQYFCQGSITKDESALMKHLVVGLALSKIRGVSRNALDTICITAFVGLTMTAIYDNYFAVHNAVVSVSMILCSSMLPSVGNSIAKESLDKNYADMRRFNFMYMLLAGWATVCLFCLYQPFMNLWMGRDLMLGYYEVAAFCLYFYMLKMGDIRWVYFEGSGLWWKGRYIAVSEIFLNLFLNILLAKYWGVLGVITATLFSLFFVNFICSAHVLFKEYFRNDRLHEFFMDHAYYFGVTLCISVLCYYLCEILFSELRTAALFPSDLVLISRLFICTIVSAAGYFFVYRRTPLYGEAMEWLLIRFRAFFK